MLTILKGLPLSYFKDLQDDKEIVFKSNEIIINCINILNEILKNYKNKIHSLFHFGEFARIYQSFVKFEACFKSNSIGTNAVFNFCLKNKIKLIYSATSASLGNGCNDKNLSP